MDNVSGAQVRRLRELMKLSQEQLAERAGIDRTVVVKIEGGANKLSSFASRSAIAKGFGLTIETLGYLLCGAMTAEEALDGRRSEATTKKAG